MIGIVASINGEEVRQRLTCLVPARTSGGILAGLAILNIVRQIALIVTALTSQALVDKQELALWIDDFTVAYLALLVGGFLLLRRKMLGYVVGAGLRPCPSANICVSKTSCNRGTLAASLITLDFW